MTRAICRSISRAALPQGARRVVPTAPYAIIASVFNLEDDIDAFIEAFGAYRDRVWLVSDGSTDNTVMRLRRAGWRCLDDAVNRRKPGALRALLETLPDAHRDRHGDRSGHSHPRHASAGSSIDLERFISDFQHSGAAAACPRIMIEPDGFLARFQAFEYALAFRVGRASLAGLQHHLGRCRVYRRDALVLRAAGALAVGVCRGFRERGDPARAHGERIYYDGRLVVSTEGPGHRCSAGSRSGSAGTTGCSRSTPSASGKIWRISRRTPFAMYHFILYIGVLSLGLHLVKMLSAVLLVASFARGLDRLLLDDWVPAGALDQSRVLHRGDRQLSCARRHRAVHDRAESRSAPTSHRSCRSICSMPLRTSRR